MLRLQIISSCTTRENTRVSDLMSDLIIKLGRNNSKWHIVLRNYEGPWKICPQLLDAIKQRGDDKYGKSAMHSYDHIEILGEAKD